MIYKKGKKKKKEPIKIETHRPSHIKKIHSQNTSSLSLLSSSFC